MTVLGWLGQHIIFYYPHIVFITKLHSNKGTYNRISYFTAINLAACGQSLPAHFLYIELFCRRQFLQHSQPEQSNSGDPNLFNLSNSYKRSNVDYTYSYLLSGASTLYFISLTSNMYVLTHFSFSVTQLLYCNCLN